MYVRGYSIGIPFFVLCRRPTQLTSTIIRGTKPSVLASGHQFAYDSSDFLSIRQIPVSALTICGPSIGKGVFGKCFHASLASHRSVCVKVFRRDKKYTSVFPIEAVLTSKLCHPNLPWLYGRVSTEESKKMLVMSFHSVQGNPRTLYGAIHGETQDADFSRVDWRIILLGLASAVKYIHDSGILHNDIKSDNILLDEQHSDVRCVLIDFGKGCFVAHGKNYKLSNSSKHYYKQYHPQVAPDLIDGHCKQSTHSDIYSVGRVIKQVNDKFLNIPALVSYGSLCTEYLCTNRPSTHDLHTFLHNLLST